MRAQEQLGIVEAVKIIDRIARAEFDPLDFLQINVVDLLRDRCRAAVFKRAKDSCRASSNCPLNMDGSEELFTV